MVRGGPRRLIVRKCSRRRVSRASCSVFNCRSASDGGLVLLSRGGADGAFRVTKLHFESDQILDLPTVVAGGLPGLFRLGEESVASAQKSSKPREVGAHAGTVRVGREARLGGCRPPVPQFLCPVALAELIEEETATLRTPRRRRAGWSARRRNGSRRARADRRARRTAFAREATVLRPAWR